MAKKEKRITREEEEEIMKAAAWAWYLHGVGAPTRQVKESNPRDAQPVSRPSRFKIESLALSDSPTPVFRRRRSMSVDASAEFPGAERVFTRSSLLDSYEMAVVSRQLESGLSSAISRGKSAAGMSGNSWIERGISGDLCNNNRPKVSYGGPKVSYGTPKASRLHKAKRLPAMCGSTDVFVPGEMQSVRQNPQDKKGHSWLLSGLARKSELYIK